MTTEATLTHPVLDAAPQRDTLAQLRGRWPLVLLCALFAVPTVIRLAEQSWSQEIGAHGPIVLATGLWLLSRCDWRAPPVRSRAVEAVVWVGIVAALGLYVFGRAYDFLALESAGLYAALVGFAATRLGLQAIWRNAFPLFYLAFLIPPPGWVIDLVTAPLQHLVSYAATELLQILGYPVQRSGVAIEVAQYRLLVEQACSGMNSIIGLTAVTLFYIYLLHASSWRYALLLSALILPIAVFVNFLRVLVLIFTTYYYGDAVAQGVFHNTAGVALFAMALAVTFLVDASLRRFLDRRAA